MATALMLECLAARGLTFSRTHGERVSAVLQAKTKIPIDPEKARAIMKTVEKQAAEKVEKVDGVKALDG